MLGGIFGGAASAVVGFSAAVRFVHAFALFMAALAAIFFANLTGKILDRV